ncbi:hypothetical protein HBN50_14160 [Halobacteriovorax sp. GB3]|uniref:hypothetical protein n=1 Tax=Halobacteriovorax sp. GB3 TaxID=2719615 RepID=UPI0023612BFF|nr:hypothetical protein [Halobacteriovorax sp. GB3]MDD0854253.1 hypothetical protein [Halobacteriovorax sp. GB3]
MQACLKSIVPSFGKRNVIDLFGYTTKGIPGVDIIGLGKRGKVLKEKNNFITRSMQIQIPMRRYVLCFDDERLLELGNEEFKLLELPVLILFWSLAGVVPIKNLEDCICSGKFDVRGQITCIDPEEFNLLEHEKYKWITSKRMESEDYHILPIEDLLEASFQTSTPLMYSSSAISTPVSRASISS